MGCANSPAYKMKSPPMKFIAPATDPISPPMESIAPPMESISPPTEFIAPPIDPISPPTESIAPPMESISPPTDSIGGGGDEKQYEFCRLTFSFYFCLRSRHLLTVGWKEFQSATGSVRDARWGSCVFSLNFMVII